jgi:hypothetical protein
MCRGQGLEHAAGEVSKKTDAPSGVDKEGEEGPHLI